MDSPQLHPERIATPSPLEQFVAEHNAKKAALVSEAKALAELTAPTTLSPAQIAALKSDPPKPGIKTSEFWLPIIFAALAAGLEKAGLGWVANIIAGGALVSAGAYPISRGMVKK